MRHIVDVMRPTKALDDRGQLQGKDTHVIKGWPCSIDTVNGNKANPERMVVANADFTVKGYGDPSNPIALKDYLTGGTLGNRVLTIEHKSDRNLNEVHLTLTCSETKIG